MQKMKFLALLHIENLKTKQTFECPAVIISHQFLVCSADCLNLGDQIYAHVGESNYLIEKFYIEDGVGLLFVKELLGSRILARNKFP